MICETCEEEISRTENGIIRIHRLDQDSIIESSIYFHEQCFREVSGSSYLEKLGKADDWSSTLPYRINDSGSLEHFANVVSKKYVEVRGIQEQKKFVKLLSNTLATKTNCPNSLIQLSRPSYMEDNLTFYLGATMNFRATRIVKRILYHESGKVEVL